MKTILSFDAILKKVGFLFLLVLSFAAMGQTTSHVSNYAQQNEELEPQLQEVVVMHAKLNFYASVVENTTFTELVGAYNTRLIHFESFPVASISIVNDALMKWLLDHPSSASEYRALVKDMLLQLERIG